MGLGLGGTDTPQVRVRKSISNERTFSATKDEPLLYQKLGTYSVFPCHSSKGKFFRKYLYCGMWTLEQGLVTLRNKNKLCKTECSVFIEIYFSWAAALFPCLSTPLQAIAKSLYFCNQ